MSVETGIIIMSFKYNSQEELAQQLSPLLIDENAQKV